MLSIEDYKILIPRKAYSGNIGLYCLIIIFTFVRVDKPFGTLKKLEFRNIWVAFWNLCLENQAVNNEKVFESKSLS